MHTASPLRASVRAQAHRVVRSLALPLLLLAVLLQVDAVVKSTVMNLVGMGMDGVAGSVSMCSGPMADGEETAARPASGHRSQGAQDHRAVCSYCAAAAHAPTLGLAEPLRPSCAASFASFRLKALRGPRGPPTLAPRARGPPLNA